jgi:hypothetical protein
MTVGTTPSASTIALTSAARAYRPIAANLDRYYIRRPSLYLAAIVVAYLATALLFAVTTPDWQNPDEPAHYNNIAHLAATGELPVLRIGDYDQVYLSELLARRFPADMSIAGLRYESYQPPLYYLAATPVFLATDGSLLALRLFNVALGAIAVLLLYTALVLVFPTKPLLFVGATGFAAFLPMHVAMNASVNNDGLAEVLLLAALMVLLRWMKRRFYRATPPAEERRPVPARAIPYTLLVLGLLLGLGLWTKIYAYMAVVLCCALVVLVVWLRPRVDDNQPGHGGSWQTFRRGVVAALWVAAPASLLALPLWLRNARLYGGWDILGLGMHDAVVAGQPTTGEWIAHYGWMGYTERAVSFTFRSFWGVFGWMGIFMEERVYTMLWVFSGIVALGLLWALVRFICGRPETDMDRYQFWTLGFFGVMVLAVFVAYGWYNVKFVQHQGRYFFWGLLPLSAFVALGWREVMQPLQGKVTGFIVGVLTVALVIAALAVGIRDNVVILLTALLAVLLVSQPFLLSGAIDAIIIGAPVVVQRWLGRPALGPLLGVLRVVAWASPFLVLLALDWLIPFRYTLPQLAK